MLLVIGEPSPSSVGSVHMYYLGQNNQWVLSERIVAENPGTGTGARIQYGASVGVTEKALIVGSPANDVPATDSGSAFIYTVIEKVLCQ